MASSAECLVWHWLNRVFFDHHIMIKTPVTRFTLPSSKENGAHWYQLLSGVYCTFTVCASDGHVVGCVDVIGPSGISRSNRQLKLTLLSQCGIAYLVVKPNRLPALSEVRTEFLGDKAFMPGNKVTDDAIVTTAHQLRTAVHRLRDQRPSDFGRLEPDRGNSSGSGPESLLSDSDFSSGPWQQADSFIAPLDSRPATLH
ncbi:hypothetical protein [Caenimonas soli]|uniref:hypothetical protein n=1 Tax=Caenimonas soli TaxID=2735555 RepID=UPI0015530A73|nr:hypothetical protein [Caenimonas soli]